MKSVDCDLVTVSEAASILGISPQAVYSGLRKGIVRHVVVDGLKMIARERLEQRWLGLSDLEAFAHRCNASLDTTAWGAPPWPADRWQTLRVVMELAEGPSGWCLNGSANPAENGLVLAPRLSTGAI